eukprot:SAG31_NODE_1631_length_7698_cov_2.501908_3_plen_110_part_00
MFDVDGSGEIDASEFGAVATELGVQMDEAETEALVKVSPEQASGAHQTLMSLSLCLCLNFLDQQIDADGSGEIDLQEFTSWFVGLVRICSDGFQVSDFFSAVIKKVLTE